MNVFKQNVGRKEKQRMRLQPPLLAITSIGVVILLRSITVFTALRTNGTGRDRAWRRHAQRFDMMSVHWRVSLSLLPRECRQRI